MLGILNYRLAGVLMPAAVLSLTVAADAGLRPRPPSLSTGHTSQDAFPPIPPIASHTNQDGEKDNPPDPLSFDSPLSAEWDRSVNEELTSVISAPMSIALSDAAPDFWKAAVVLDIDALPTIDELYEPAWLEPLALSDPPASASPPLLWETSHGDLAAPSAGGVGPVFAQPIPVPGAMTLLGLGLAGALARRRRT